MDSFDLSKQRIAQLEQIPDDIRRQIDNENSVEYALDLSFNRLRKIEAIGVFEHVRQLDLSENQLENVNGLQVLRSLQSIDLSRNGIASIDLLALLPALQILKVAENSLTTIDALQLLPELRVVDASYNRIAKWPLLVGLNLLEALDLSDNMLGSFSSSVSESLFPSRLRRLSIARNQIDQLCGIACLGLHLPSLELFDFDGNPIALEIGRSGGQLERLFGAVFSNLPLGNDGGLTVSRRKDKDVGMLSHSLHTLKRIILEGHEEDLFDFLVTGTLTSQDDCAGVRCAIPPPPPVERPPFHWKQPSTLQTGDLMSHDDKFETCKRLQENGLTQISDFASVSSRVEGEKAVRWREQSVPSNKSQNDARMPLLTTADLDGPERSSQFVPTCSNSSLKPLDAIVSSSIAPMTNSLSLNGGEHNVLLKKLTDQVTTIRKYMKIWIRRDKLLRIASASKIQRWLRRNQGNFELRQRVLRSRSRRQDEYSFHHCTFTTNYSRGLNNDDLNAQRIQSLVRGFIVRQRIVQFKQKHRAACSIQHFWKRINLARQEIFPDLYDWSSKGTYMKSRILYARYYTAVRGMVRCSRDVRELQHVCAVQDKAISRLWSDRMDREEATQVVPENPNHSQQSAEISKMKCQINQQTIELDRLKQQVETLQNLVAESRK